MPSGRRAAVCGLVRSGVVALLVTVGATQQIPVAVAAETGAGRSGVAASGVAQYRGAGSCHLWGSPGRGSFGAVCSRSSRRVSRPAELLGGMPVPSCWLRWAGSTSATPPGDGTAGGRSGEPVTERWPPRRELQARELPPQEVLVPEAPALEAPAPEVSEQDLPGRDVPPQQPPPVLPEPPPPPARLLVDEYCLRNVDAVTGEPTGVVDVVRSTWEWVEGSPRPPFWWELTAQQREYAELLDGEERQLPSPRLRTSPTIVPRVRQQMAFHLDNHVPPAEIRHGDLRMRAVLRRLTVHPGEPRRDPVSCAGPGRPVRAGEAPGRTGEEVCWFGYLRSSVAAPGGDGIPARTFSAEATADWVVEFSLDGGSTWQTFTTMPRRQRAGVRVTEVQTLVVP